MKNTSQLIWQDTQHQVLFDLIDQLQHKQMDSSVFKRLSDYAEHHFALEEAYMERIDYPGRDAHIDAHNKFRKELATMLEEHHHYDEQLRRSLSLFLSEWLKRHVLGIDKQLEQFILDADIK